MQLFKLCLKIFLARIVDVTLGTIRTNFSVRGRTLLSGFVAFIEVFIWFLVVKEALNTDIESLWIVVSYSGGYACGTILGTFIAKHINSLISVEVITTKCNKDTVDIIRKKGYGVSVVKTRENYKEEETCILFITLNSRYLEELKKIIRTIDEKAFIVVNDTKVVQNGYIK